MRAHADRHAGRPVGGTSARSGPTSGETRGRRSSSSSARTRRSPRWSTNGWPRTRPRPASRPSKVEGFRNRDGQINTIRVDSKVVHETDTGEAKSDETRWMRFTLDTVGKADWPTDRQGRPIYPEGFEELAKKLERPLHPPGRDVRCIVSVGMLTEGWDCNTVTHIIGLRPFMSQLLCEQVVGRGLRRRSYEVGRRTASSPRRSPRSSACRSRSSRSRRTRRARRRRRSSGITSTPLPAKAAFEIHFPRVEGYTQAIRNRVTVDWPTRADADRSTGRIPPEVEVKGAERQQPGPAVADRAGPSRRRDPGTSSAPSGGCKS